MTSPPAGAQTAAATALIAEVGGVAAHRSKQHHLALLAASGHVHDCQLVELLHEEAVDFVVAAHIRVVDRIGARNLG